MNELICKLFIAAGEELQTAKQMTEKHQKRHLENWDFDTFYTTPDSEHQM